MNLDLFNKANLFDAATGLFHELKIKLNSNTAESLPAKDILKHHYKDNDTFKTIDKTYFIGIIDDSVFKETGLFDINYSYKDAIEQGEKNYNGLMLFALELNKQPTRTEISELTRAFNRISQKMPVALVLKYTVANEAVISIAISERFKYLQNWRQGEKAGKVIILRDIHTQNTHAGHTRILQDLVKPVGVSTYEQLHQHWLQVLDVSILNKKFFQELSNWYFSAMNEVSFPDDKEKKKEIRNATNLIRLITRVIFIWFIKEKQLVPASLFRKDFVASILKDFNKNKKSQNYYNAILQNLFFGTLNQKMEERKFAKDGDIKTNKEEYGVKNLFRYADLFNIPEKEVLALFKDVPFLNGGLFDCLDKPNDDGKIEYVDGFSRNAKKQASVPDYIFFGEEKEVDLNEVYGTKNKHYSSRGLINLLESYKFTVAENTPIEEEIALDPELLGKVFENLLASYNPETQTTARKQTGSFYTPREIVNYMVDESLLEYIKQNVKNESQDFETRLRDVFSYYDPPAERAGNPNPFSEAETKDLIEAINNSKILDPACGSGAFPMGILHKMVHILQKLDPDNKHWKDLQRKKAIEETEAAFKIGDKEERAKRLAEINDVFENNASDYGRKLYLIENCIYGIDIQPIAVQIAKLRFFISLVIDQKVNKSKENFGVRSLPNLETKFVAANTLIGLDKPQQFLLRNPDIEVKENELKELRHKYFTANTRKEKIALQKQDKKLRLEIAKMLESDGWETKVAKQIVAFDPYDQNQSSGWFDTEWMFGLRSGFDVVIGNPPYHQLSKDPSASNEYKLYLKQRFGTSGGRLNTFIFFTHIGIELMKLKGVITYIIPNTILTQDYYKDTRKLLLEKTTLTQIVSYDKLPFENAVVENVTFFAVKDISTNYTIKHFYDTFNGIELDKTKSKSDFTKSDTYSFNFGSNEITDSLLRDTIPLASICNINQAIALKGDKSLSLRDSNPKGKFYKLLDGRNINRYSVDWGGVYLDYNLDRIHSCKTKDIFTTPEKLMFRRVSSKLIFCYDDEQYFALNTIVVVNLTNTKEYKIKYLLGILNSKLMDYYYRNKHKSTKTVFSEIQARSVGELPIKKARKEWQNVISNIVEYIILLKKYDTDTTFLERVADALVYELYFPDLIQSNKANLFQHVNEAPKFQKGKDEVNLKNGEKIIKEYSNPKHPVSAELLHLLTINEINTIEGRE